MGEMMVHSHADSRTTNMIRDFSVYSNPAWYDPKKHTQLVKMMFDSAKDRAFIVHLEGRTIALKLCSYGLYFHNMKHKQFLFLNTVKNNKKIYTKRETKKADAARKLQQVL